MPDMGVGEEVVEGMVVVIQVSDERRTMDLVVDVEVRIVVRVCYWSLRGSCLQYYSASGSEGLL